MGGWYFTQDSSKELAEVTIKKWEKKPHEKYLREETSRQRYSKCKVSEVRLCLVCSKDSKKADIARVWWERIKVF